MLDLKRQTLLILAPHPDDEILGCAGLIQRIKHAGGRIYVLFLTVGDTKDYTAKGLSTEKERRAEIEKVAKLLKYDDYEIAYPGGEYHLRLDQLPQKDLISRIENSGRISLDKIQPTIVATTHPADYNQDHRACAEAVFAATRPKPRAHKESPSIVLGYDSVATSQWANVPTRQSNFFIELSTANLQTKINAMKLYKSQIRNGGHQRSVFGIKTIAQYRGFQAGVSLAEGYFTYRLVI